MKNSWINLNPECLPINLITIRPVLRRAVPANIYYIYGEPLFKFHVLHMITLWYVPRKKKKRNWNLNLSSFKHTRTFSRTFFSFFYFFIINILDTNVAAYGIVRYYTHKYTRYR